MAGILFEDIFDVKDIDPEGKKFDRGKVCRGGMREEAKMPTLPKWSPLLSRYLPQETGFVLFFFFSSRMRNFRQLFLLYLRCVMPGWPLATVLVYPWEPS